MTVIVCIDTGRGMTFFGRRQSTDSVLRERIIAHAEGRPLVMDSYSASQFRDDDAPIEVTEEPFAAGPDAVVFTEDADPGPFAALADRLIIYRWNRIYPRDMTLTFDPFEEGMRLESILDFKGSSHDRITEEIWTRKEKTEDPR